MKAVFRVDASSRMGTGHLVRCLTLAQALRERGAQTRFICREHAGHLLDLLGREAMPVTVLPAPAGGDSTDGEGHARWLGVKQEEDARQTIEALDGEEPDWLVVDNYGLDLEWERELRPHVGRLMVIDDLANRRHECDVLLDQNYSGTGDGRYAKLVPAACKLLLGPRYALLRPEYTAYRRTLLPRGGKIRRILVFFGGTDPQNLTALSIEALSHPELKHLEIDVVVGANNPHRDALEKLAEARPHTRIHGHRSHLADLMARADLALGAGGVTTWERMCLGVPSVVVSIAENQRPACEALAKARLVSYAGHCDGVDAETLSQHVIRLCGASERLSDLVLLNQREVDGLGTARLAEILCPSGIDQVRLRYAREDDNAFGRGMNLNSRALVTEACGLPVGQIRLEPDGDESRVDCSLDDVVQGRGWESLIVNMAVRLIRDARPLRLRTEETKGNDVPASTYLRFNRPMSVHETRSDRSLSIAILSDRPSWLNDYIPGLMWDWLVSGHRVLWVHDKKELLRGDFCFYLSFGEIVSSGTRSLYRHNLVVHESDLPRGKGWSPLTWQILEGSNRIPVTLLEAAEHVDSGVIYAQEWLEYQGHELVDELRSAQVGATLKLCKRFVAEYPKILEDAREQIGTETRYPRRRPADSGLDATMSIGSQFDLLRVVDNRKYPAFFEYRGHRYVLAVAKSD